MTTVVYCRTDRVLAADRRVVNGCDKICAPMTKIRRLSDGSMVGVSGSVAALQLVAEWLDGGCEGRFRGPEDSEYLVISPDGDVHQIQDGIMFEIEDDIPYMGSGGQVALGAMAQGATAQEAVMIASRYDINSGDGVDMLQLGKATS